MLGVARWLGRVSGPLRVDGKLSRCVHVRSKSKSSNKWLERQGKDQYTQKAKAEDYKSRAAYKLKEIDSKYKLFRRGQTIVDLGFAPGSWSQVAVKATQPGGRVIGVDLLFVEPPEGVTAIQGNFLDPGVQLELETMLSNPERGRYISRDAPRDRGTIADLSVTEAQSEDVDGGPKQVSPRRREPSKADVVLSDMCGIWPQETGFWTNSINTPYRLANTSGIVARDHATSIDLCDAALVFSISHLRHGGSFVCKFYTGSEDVLLEKRLKRVFKRVHRVKPNASRSESREAYFVALKKQKVSNIEDVFAD